MVRKTKEEALATRNAILDAAEIVFQERGVSKTSLAEIAAAAGVTRGAIYWHFANKVDLFNAMTQRIHGLMDAKLAELEEKQPYDDPVELLRELALHFLDRVANDPHYHRIIGIVWHKCEYVGEMAEICERHLERSSRFRSAGIQAFETSRAAGFLPPQVAPHTAVIGMMAIVDGLIGNWMLDNSAFALVDTGARIIDSYLAGLRVPRRPSCMCPPPARHESVATRERGDTSSE